MQAKQDEFMNQENKTKLHPNGCFCRLYKKSIEFKIKTLPSSYAQSLYKTNLAISLRPPSL